MANITNIAGTTSGNQVKLDNQLLDVYSKEILFTAQPNLKFETVAKVQTELQSVPGTTIKFLRYAALTGSDAIAETATIEAQGMSTSLVSISVSEHAAAIEVSELLLRASTDQVLDRAATLLGNNYALNRDKLVRDVLYGGSNVLYGTSRADRNAITGTDYLTVDLIRDAVETLATNKAPKFGDGYVCFVHPHQARRLRGDSAWINVANYAAPQNMLNGEIGRIEDVRFIETTMVQKVVKGADTTHYVTYDDGVSQGASGAVATTLVPATGVSVYRAIICGDYAVGLAEALPVEMRDNGVVDFGRKHAIAFYGIWGAGLIEGGHCLTIETA